MMKNLLFGLKHYLSKVFFLIRHSVLFSIIKWFVLVITISLSVGSTSAFFLHALDWVTNTRELHKHFIYALPVVGFLIGWVYLKYGKTAARGNQLLIAHMRDPNTKIPIILAPLVFFGTLATHLFGGSAGREGTALQMAGAIATQLSKPFGLSSEDKQLLLLAALASGFGAVFGTPLTGVVFAIEVFMVGKLKIKTLFIVLLASFCSDWVAQLWQAPHTQYLIHWIPKITFINFIYVIIAGVLFGWCATIFSKSLHWLTLTFKKLISYPPFRTLLGGLIIVLAVWLLETTDYIGLGIPIILASFEIKTLFYVFLIKILLTVITLASGFKGGEVTPLFFIGATLGSALSLIIPLPTALLAGLGFVAVFAGATNAPIACTIMAVELFGIDIGIFAAIVCFLSYLSSGKTSIYESFDGKPRSHFIRELFPFSMKF